MPNWLRNFAVALAVAGATAGVSGLVIAGEQREKLRKQEEVTGKLTTKQAEIAEDVSAIKAQVQDIKEEQRAQRDEAREQARETDAILREILRQVK